MALNSLPCADVPLSNYSVTHDAVISAISVRITAFLGGTNCFYFIIFCKL